MGRLIIDNKSSATDEQALDMVSRIISEGRVSNDGKQFCYFSTFTVTCDDKDHRYFVSTGLNKASDKFTVIDCDY